MCVAADSIGGISDDLYHAKGKKASRTPAHIVQCHCHVSAVSGRLESEKMLVLALLRHIALQFVGSLSNPAMASSLGESSSRSCADVSVQAVLLLAISLICSLSISGSLSARCNPASEKACIANMLADFASGRGEVAACAAAAAASMGYVDESGSSSLPSDLNLAIANDLEFEGSELTAAAFHICLLAA